MQFTLTFLQSLSWFPFRVLYLQCIMTKESISQKWGQGVTGSTKTDAIKLSLSNSQYNTFPDTLEYIEKSQKLA